MSEIKELVGKLIAENEVMVFSATYCPFCVKVKDLFNKLGIKFQVFELNLDAHTQELKDELFNRTNQRSVPNIFIKGCHIGGCDDTFSKFHDGSLFDVLVSGELKKYDYDLIVIGGGSGGISAAKEAALNGKRVALFDFVTPTAHKTVWGVGGTCVNVGCIPKKLMHQAAIMGELIEDSKAFGWTIPDKHSHDWKKLVENVQNHIKKLNFNYIKYFKKNNISFFNQYVTFKDKHTIIGKDKREVTKEYTAQTFILATGGRPYIPDFPGSKLAITSDDLFSLIKHPGRILIVGASYIALECAGFLHGIGIDVTVMVRSIFLRGFDQQIAEMIGKDMEQRGIKFIKGYIPNEIVEENDPKYPGTKLLKVKMANVDKSNPKEETFNTVLLAVGRKPCVTGLGLEELGIKFHESSGKILVDEFDRTNCMSVYAIGDIQHGRMELTPVAIKAGKMLAQRIYKKGLTMDYTTVPTTVFTPLEYGCCGLSEENAKEVYGQNNIESYHSRYQPLEWVLPNRNPDSCYVKLVCVKDKEFQVVGFHVLGPNAGEITQGFALGVKMKAKKSDFDALIGIHPTCAEVVTSLTVTRSAEPNADSDNKGC